MMQKKIVRNHIQFVCKTVFAICFFWKYNLNTLLLFIEIELISLNKTYLLDNNFLLTIVLTNNNVRCKNKMYFDVILYGCK